MNKYLKKIAAVLMTATFFCASLSAEDQSEGGVYVGGDGSVELPGVSVGPDGHVKLPGVDVDPTGNVQVGGVVVEQDPAMSGAPIKAGPSIVINDDNQVKDLQVDGQNIVLNSDGNTLTFNGGVGSLVINGDSSKITINGTCHSIVVNGDSNQVSADVVNGLTVNGEENRVQWKQGQAPKVVDNGDKNTLGEA